LKLIFLLLIFPLLFFKIKAQEVESVYLFKKETVFSNVHRNYSETDSLILFKNKTFRKSYSYFGFDEVDKRIFEGNWKKDKNKLMLHVNSKIDSVNLESVIPFTIIYRVKTKYLKPIDEDAKRLKRIK
jgi:hypothetical protein